MDYEGVGLRHGVLLRFFSMLKDNALAVEVGRRLRETAYELGYKTAQSLADWLGANRAQVNAWLLGVAMPPVKYMQKLTDRGVTLDWIYLGDGAGLSHAMYIRLTAALEAGKPLPEVAPEPEPAPLDAETAGRVSNNLRPRAIPPEKPKRARVA